MWTHDSIGLGGDGPTHQPIEHLAALRAIPGLDVVRPADANETAVVLAGGILEKTDGPAGLALSRQNLPVLDPAKVGRRRQGRVRPRGGVAAGVPEVILIATGSEVSLALTARDALEAEGTPTRVVSMPCVEWFEAQPASYRQQVLPPEIKARVSVEAGVQQGWREYRRRRRRDRVASSTSARAPRATCCSSSSASPPTASSRPRTPRWSTPAIRGTRPELKETPMTDALADLSAQGVSIWLDDISRERLRSGNLQDLVDTQARRRRHQQPDDLPEGAREGRRVRRAGARPRRCARSPSTARSAT